MKRFFPLLLLVAPAVWAEPSVLVQTEIAPKEVTIGDPIAVTVQVTASPDVAMKPLEFPAMHGDFELLAGSSPTYATAKDGKSVIVSRSFYTTFSTGSLTFPPLPLAFALTNGATSSDQTQPTPIHVKSILEEKGDEGNIRPLKGLFNFRSYLWLWILLGVLAIGGLVFGLWKAGLFGKKTTSAEPSGPPRPPEELAWEAIHALEDADLIHQGQIREFYYQLSIILREYLERRFGMSALDKTTTELLAEFRQRNFQLLLTNMLRSFFDNADLAKFAKFTPEAPEVETDLNQVKQFINLTIPQKPAAPEKVTV